MVLSAQVASLRADVTCAQLDGGALKVCAAPRPPTPAYPIAANQLLVVCRYGAPAFAPAVDGIARAHPVSVSTAMSSGTATWCRAESADGGVILDCDAGVGDDVECKLQTAEITEGALIEILEHTHTELRVS
jgi:hypothetical protein